ncbi:ABC transporter permease [Enterococcus sp. AZ109]|uniref:ABC transporter permease n=1 Tax=Enterococcus sp. AZ109 TaxID=2774634 RepID=UPI003F22B12F
MKEQRKIIHDLWWKSFKNNKRRNLFIVLAIALTTLLISSVLGLGMSFLEANNRQTLQRIGTTADANVSDLTQQQLDLLKKDPAVETVGIQQTIGTVDSQMLKNKKINMSLHWYSRSEWEKLRQAPIDHLTGKYPENKQEIMAPLAALKDLGITNPKIGQRITLSYFIEEEPVQQEFVLSGFYKEYVLTRVPDLSYLLVSDEFAEKYRSDNRLRTYSIKYTDGSNIYEENTRLTKKLNLSEGQEIKGTVRESGQSHLSMIIGLGMFLGIILVSGGLLIYNVLYISIANDIRFYGLLKALGTTKKQLRKIIFNQSLLLSAIGVPSGLLVGYAVSYWFIPFVMQGTNYADSIVVSTQPLIYIGAAAFSLLVMLLSSIKPANYASKVSPVLAIQFTEAKVKKGKVRSQKGGQLYFMAWRNIFRDKKRALVVILSMTLGLTSFVAVNTLVKSIDFEKFVVSEMDYDVMIDPANTTTKSDLSESNRQEQYLVTQQMTQLLDHSQGVSEERLYYGAPISVPYQEDQFAAYIQSYNQYFNYAKIDAAKIDPKHFIGKLVSIDPAEAEKLVADDAAFDPAAFKAGETGLIQSDYPEDFAGMETLDFATLDDPQQPQQLKVGGFIPNDFLEVFSQGAPVMFVAEEHFHQLAPNGGLLRGFVNLKSQQADAVSQQLKQFFNSQYAYTLRTKTDMRAQAQEEIATMRMIGNTLALILALIGLLNFVNIITTSILARQQELATLESIGMTRKQTNRVLMFEGGYYALMVTVLVGTFGIGVTYGLFTIIKKSATYASFSLSFWEIGLALLVMFIICLITPYLVMKSTSKRTLAERIKE